MTSVIRLALILSIVGVSRVALAQDALDPVRQLYASAEYEEALTALGRLKTDSGAGSVVEIDRYRVLCLMALGRPLEADQVIEAIVTSDPLYQPTAGDAAPRVRAAFTAVRRRVLPTLVRGLYADAKAAFDRKEFPEAAEKLEKTLLVLNDADAPGAELADLRTLAAGFLELSRASIPQAPPDHSVAESSAAIPEATRLPVALPPPTDPVALKQEMPKWTSALAGSLFEAEFRGVIEVDIDEQGTVVAAEITKSIHPLYDPVLLKSAREWKYEPARRGGQAVKSRKRVDVVLRPR